MRNVIFNYYDNGIMLIKYEMVLTFKCSVRHKLNGKLTSNILNQKLHILTAADAVNVMINLHILNVMVIIWMNIILTAYPIAENIKKLIIIVQMTCQAYISNV